MALPKILKNFNVFNDGNNYVGVVQKLTLPALKRKMEKYRGGGMNGEISVDMGVEALEVEHEYGGPERQLFAQWGITKADGVMLRFAGALQSDASGEVTPIEIVMRGRHEELNLGDAEGGKHSPFKVKSTLTYLKVTMNGEPVVEIDLINMVEVIDGSDRLAEQRRAIGLA